MDFCYLQTMSQPLRMVVYRSGPLCRTDRNTLNTLGNMVPIEALLSRQIRKHANLAVVSRIPQLEGGIDREFHSLPEQSVPLARVVKPGNQMFAGGVAPFLEAEKFAAAIFCSCNSSWLTELVQENAVFVNANDNLFGKRSFIKWLLRRIEVEIIVGEFGNWSCWTRRRKSCRTVCSRSAPAPR